MKCGIALPTAVAGVSVGEIRAWAQQADAGPFSSLCAIERLCHPTWDPLICLAGVATMTRRIRLMTTLLLGPLRPTGVLAQEAASLDQLSEGRLSLGLGIGGRAADYAAAPALFSDRGRRFEAQLRELHRLWRADFSGDDSPGNDSPGNHLSAGGVAGAAGEGAVEPRPVQQNGPEVLIGGTARQALLRAGRWGDGYLAGSVGPQAAERAYTVVADARQAAGRPGRPRFAGMVWYALGLNAPEKAGHYMLDYFADLGDQAAVRAQAAHVVTSAAQVAQSLRDYAAAGMDELIFLPCDREIGQVERLADIVA